MAARSFFVIVINNTLVTWANPNFSLAHGIWSQDNGEVPSSTIAGQHPDGLGFAPGVGFWSSESNGFATGTEGSVTYTGYLNYNLPNQTEVGTMHIFWDNPYVGSNSFSVDLPNRLTAQYGDIGGNDANVTVTINIQ